MFFRLSLLLLTISALAACAAGTTPTPVGRDANGHVIYALSGTDLAALEAVANSECSGAARLRMLSVSPMQIGRSDVTYVCE